MWGQAWGPGVGARRGGLLRRKQVTWGLGFEQAIAPRFDLIGETFVATRTGLLCKWACVTR